MWPDRHRRSAGRPSARLGLPQRRGMERLFAPVRPDTSCDRSFLERAGHSGFASTRSLGFQRLPRLEAAHSQHPSKPDTGHPDA